MHLYNVELGFKSFVPSLVRITLALGIDSKSGRVITVVRPTRECIRKFSHVLHYLPYLPLWRLYNCHHLFQRTEMWTKNYWQLYLAMSGYLCVCVFNIKNKIIHHLPPTLAKATQLQQTTWAPGNTLSNTDMHNSLHVCGMHYSSTTDNVVTEHASSCFWR